MLIQGTELSYLIYPKKYEKEKNIYIELKDPIGQYLRFTSIHIGNSYYYIGDTGIYFLKNEKDDNNDCNDINGGKVG